MYQTDFEQFGVLLRQLSQMFAKKLSDEMVHAYWDALKDQSWLSVKRLADQHMRFQKFFPKPSELRPKEDRSAPLSGSEGLRDVENIAIKHLEQLRQSDPAAWLDRIGDRNAARLHRSFNGNIYFDLKERCWRQV